MIRWYILLAAAVGASLSAGCGSSSQDARTVNWYVFDEPSGAYNDAVRNCNAAADGRYTIKLVPLPTNSDQQRELLVRRLAAKDSSIDVIGMDVIWTAEFANAGWIRPIPATDAAAITRGTLNGPLLSASYKKRLFAMPFTSNVQFLWYRKDRVKTPPATWDQMIQMGERLGPEGRIEVPAARYEGLTVWFNTLVNSAGGTIVDANNRVTLGPPAVEAATVMRDVARSPAADPNLSNSMEDTARLAFQSGGPAFMINWPYVYPSVKEDAPQIFKVMGVARYPSVVPGEPSRVTLGGINLGVSAFSRHPRLALDAAECLRGPRNQSIAAQKGGLPPTIDALYSQPAIRQAYPGFTNLMKQTIDDGVPRPVSPAYSDVSLAIQDTLHPPASIDPARVVAQLRDKLDIAAKGGIY